MSESNQRPTDYKSVALPAELKWPANIPEAHPGKTTIIFKEKLPVFSGLQRYTKTLFDKILINVFKCDFKRRLKKPQMWL